MQRHLGLVYCAAHRLTRSDALGKDVAQEVFIRFARQPGIVEDGARLWNVVEGGRQVFDLSLHVGVVSNFP